MTNYSFGYWLRRRRMALDQTQRQLADQVGCALSMIKKIELDERRPSAPLAERLAAALGVTAEQRHDFLQAARALRSAESLEVPHHPLIGPPDAPPGLPVQTTTFIGRTAERKEVAAILRAGQQRVLSIVGPGGIGKTRLALAVASDLRADFPAGIWFAELAPIADPQLVAATVAAAIGLEEQADSSPLARLIAHTRVSRALLVLDNCEHLVAACAGLVAELGRASATLHIVVTSRELLGVQGEVVFQLQPFAAPAADASASLANDAVHLFVDRAALVAPGFALTAANAAAIEHICRCVDGIPLALELAAARVGFIDVAVIAARMDSMLSVLQGGQRTLLPHQQTVQATLDWSHALLTEAERVVFRRLAVFANGWYLEAAEQIVCDGTPHDLLARDAVLHALAELAKKSLVACVRLEGSELRYRLLAPIREYAYRHLVAAAEESATLDRLLAYYLSQIEPADQRLRLLRPPRRRHLALEMDNIRVALDWAGRSDLDSGLRLAGNMGNLALNHGYIREYIAHLSGLLASETAVVSAAVRAYALAALAQLNWPISMDRARRYAEASLELHQTIDDPRGKAWSLATLGATEGYMESYELACARLEESVAIYRSIGDHQSLAWALVLLADFLSHDYARWAACLEEAHHVYQAADDIDGLLKTCEALGMLSIWNGDLARGEVALAEMMALYQRTDTPARPELACSVLAMYQGDYARARQIAQAGLEQDQPTGNTGFEAWWWVQLGYIALREGRLDAARASFGEAAQRFESSGAAIGMVYALEGRASLATQQGHPVEATLLFAWADATREHHVGLRPPIEQANVDRDLGIIRAALDPAAYATACSRGRALSQSEALAIARGI
jgi:predicted ATPase/transcriptional regulator with XRE-family HTH domain